MGRYLVVADVHSNLRALESVLHDAACRGGFDAIWVLGDIVGYGPEPDECLNLLREWPLHCVAGNHDLGVVGRAMLDRFTPLAAEACLWTRQRLSASSLSWLRDLPLRQVQQSFVLVHGSPRDPVWEYVTSGVQARSLAPFCEATHCLVGHTHRPLVLNMEQSDVALAPEVRCDGVVALSRRLLINPGAVGQPRDGDARAAFGMLDTERGAIALRRVPYDIDSTVAAMRRAGLPLPLAIRLHAGY